MKQYKNQLLTLAALLLTAVSAWAGNVTVKTSPADGGTVVASQAAAGETCKLTVTPAAGYYITAADITAVTTLDGGGVQAPVRRADGIAVGGETVAITATDDSADPSGVTTYTFTMPADEALGVEVTAAFQTQKAISPVVTIEGWTYGAEPKTPSVSGNTGNGEVSFTYAAQGATAFTGDVPTAAGNYIVKAVIAAAGMYAGGEATAQFTISKAAAAVTKEPAAVANLVYTGQALALITAGEATGGELQYKLGTDGTYSTTVPSATAAGTYTIYYKVVADGNHTDVAEKSTEVTIGKAAAAVTTEPAAVANLIYTGQALALITAGEATGGELQYKLGTDGTYSTTVPSATAAGTYTIYYKVVADANHTDVAEKSTAVTIGKAAAAVTKEPAAVANLVYTGQALTLITAGEATGGELQYKLGTDGTYSTTIPSATAAGTYTIYYKVVADANHTDVAEKSIEVTIGKAAATVTKEPAAVADLVYTGQALALITAGEATGGELQYKLGTDGAYSTTIPSATAAGTYTIYYKMVADANHTDVAEKSIEVTIGKAAAAVTKEPAAVADLIYTGQALALITAGEATGGELQYKLGTDGTYSTTIPSATAAGTYTVYYKVVADANHTDVAEKSIAVTIGKAAATVTKEPAAVANLVYTGQALALITAGEATGGELQYKLGTDGTYSTTVPSATAAGTYTIYYKVVADANHTDVAEKSIEVTIGKAAAAVTKEPAADANLVYTGQALALITAGEATGGELQYKLGTDGTYSTTVPSATAAGTYTIYYKVVADANHTDVAEKSMAVTIGKAAAAVTKEPTAVADLVYTGQALALITAGEATGGELQYKLGTDGTYSTTIPSATAAGTYTVYYKVVADANHTDVAEKSTAVTIGKAVAAVTTEPAAVANLVYTGQALALITAGEATGGELQYKLGTDGAYSTTVPSATAAGTYTIYYKVMADANHTDVAEKSIEVTIGKAAAAVTKEPAAVADLVYTGQALALMTAGEATGGELQYKLGTDGAYSTTIPSATAAGTYTIYYKVVADANHTDVAEKSTAVTIGKAAAAVTEEPAAVADLVYTGQALALITAGEATGGELQYKLGTDGTYSTTIPSATAAGTYTIYYKVVADANHTDVAEKSMAVTIGKAAAAVTKEPAAVTDLVYTGRALALITVGEATGGELQYKLGTDGTYSTTIPSATAAGTYTVYYKVVADANHTDVAEKSIEVTIGKAAAAVTKEPAAVANLIYTGQALALITAGEATGGELQYKLGTDGTYSTTIPSATAAGTYTVYYKVVADASYTAPEAASVEVTIAKAEIKPTVSLQGWTYGTEANSPVVEGNTGKGEVTITYAAKGSTTFSATVPSTVGTYTVKATIAETANYQGGEATAEFNITAAAITVTAPKAIENLVYTTSRQTLITAGTTSAGEMQYKLGENGTYSTTLPQAANAGTYTIYYKVVADAGYTVPEEGMVAVTIAKATPEMTVKNESVSLDALDSEKWTTNAVSITVNDVEMVTGGYTFTYTSSDESVVSVDEDGRLNPKGVGEATITVRGPIGDANLNEAEVTYPVTVYTTYGISITNGTTTVNIDNRNRTDVFGDGTVKFDGKQMLVLNGFRASGTSDAAITVSNIPELRVYLMGENSIEGAGSAFMHLQNNGKLIFTTEGNTPGTLTMKATEKVPVVSGFSTVSFEQNLTILSGAVAEQEMFVGTPIAPIAAETDETKEVAVAQVASTSTETLSNTTIDNVLYTLIAESDGTGDKVDTQANCIVLASTMVEDDVTATVTTYKPGTDSFAQAFQGLTFMVPAGTGKVIVNVKTGEEGVLNVKIGDEEPYVIQHALDFTEYEIPYACTEATYVYIYNASRVVAAAPGHRAGKKTTITVGVRTVGVIVSEAQESNATPAAVESAEEPVTEPEDIEITVGGGAALINNVGVTSLPDNFFADMTFVNNIDLRLTSISGMEVSRESGAFKGVSPNTFIYLPTGNSTKEDNVVFGKICKSVRLDANMGASESFRLADAVTAQRVALDRVFSKGEMTTVYLPFAIDYQSAAEFGRFFTFSGIENGQVKTDEVTTDLQANTPYLFQAKDDGVQIVMKAVRVSMPAENAGAPARRAAAENGLYGCYDHQTAGDGTLYRLVAGETAGDIRFVRMTGSDSVPPFQAYLKLSGQEADSFGVTDNSQTTGITSVGVDSEQQGDVWHTTSGVRLQQKPAAKGVYIRNGKKIVVK